MNWGGVSVDPGLWVMMVNSMYYGTILQLVPRAQADQASAASNGPIQSHNFSLPLPQSGAPYAVLLSGFESPLNVPCNQPPYGRMERDRPDHSASYFGRGRLVQLAIRALSESHPIYRCRWVCRSSEAR